MTQQDLGQLKSLFSQEIEKALKENNKNLVTKKHLEIALEENNKNLVTKKDLEIALEENNKNLVTKKDLEIALEENNKNLVTKDDLYENNKRLAKVFATKQDLEKLVTKDEYHQTVDQILTSLDNIYGIVKNSEPENLITAHKLRDHESRLTKVETHVFAN